MSTLPMNSEIESRVNQGESDIAVVFRGAGLNISFHDSLIAA